MPKPDPVTDFIQRWSDQQSRERANYGLFLSELCDLLDVPRPDPSGPDTAKNAYVFEREVTFQHRGGKTSTGFIDLYRRGSFVLEAKQYAAKPTEEASLALAFGEPVPKNTRAVRGSEAWDRAMIEAHAQAERYARSLPTEEDPPPFLLVVDVGHVIEVFADFSQKGKAYIPFPEPRSHRIRLAELADPEKRQLLRSIWLDPRSLDPAKVSAKVTREVASHLAELAKSFEKKHDAKLVAEFLSRCLFCMFAEDVGLLPKESFKSLLDSVKADPGSFVPMLELLFEDMNQGRFSGLLKKKLLYFNGGLFASARALPVNGTQLGLLRTAANCEWKHVEPAIFGTLLERALNPDERHKLGAHYTPRAYVERLVLPTVVEPLREEWTAQKTAAVTLANRGNDKNLKEAKALIRAFHGRLCSVRVLDPACGSGNFLYVTLEHLKRLEGEVVDLLRELGDETGFFNVHTATVDPHQFLGIEINPRAASIAELVLWIGYLQWHFRVHGDALPAEPVLRKFNNIENCDAVLAYDEEQLARDEQGKIRYVWDRKTMKVDAVTGRNVPDDKAVIPLKTYVNPRPAKWPQADYIVGNPPFLGDKVMRQSLGEGYVETLRKVYSDVPESADFVMYWWHKAAELVLDGESARFGLITTNSIKQTFNRRVVRRALLQGVSLRFAIPDHPWVDTTEGASVRIAMSVGALSYKLPEKAMVSEAAPDPSALEGELLIVHEERPRDDGSHDVVFSSFTGRIASDFTVGADVSETVSLKANDGISVNGMMLAGRGFVLSQSEAITVGLGSSAGIEKIVRPLLNGRDLTDAPRGFFVIDLFGYTVADAREKFPKVYNAVVTRVKPERDSNARLKLKKDWWIFGEPRKSLRLALAGLPRYIATVETAKHRVFQFIDAKMVAEHKLVAIALSDAFHLGVLSSRIHVAYALASGSTLEDRPVYPKSRCFDPFPFPDCTEKQKERIRKLAEELDAHRKRVQAKHGLGLTDIYNVLEKVRAGTGLMAKNKVIHDAALVSTLKQLHDDLDQAVAAAYGWAWPLSDADILEKVVALNTARAAEEARGQIRWLRPDYQQPLFTGDKQGSLGLEDGSSGRKAHPKSQTPKPRAKTKTPWPKTLAERAKAVEVALSAAEHPVTSAELTKQFSRAKEKEVAEILDTLCALGRAHEGDKKGTYVR